MPSDLFRRQTAHIAAAITTELGGRPLDAALGEWLNRAHGPSTATWQALAQSCRDGVAEGWLCQRGEPSLRYGRIFKPADDLHGYSVDVVDMHEIAGPHHVHPQGEIDLIVPIDDTARFDGHGAGWLVCPPGSAHRPTVSGGRALVMYLLPQGAIEFTRTAA